MTAITDLSDLHGLYRRRVPKMFVDYCDSGSWTEQTYRDNAQDFQSVRLRQRVGVDVSARSTVSAMLGQPVQMPLALAPVGLLGMQSADGEIKAARAAERFGVPFCLSTMSICSIEEVAAHTTKPFWMQVYTLRDDDFMGRLMARARAAGCEVMVLTVDLPVLGQRHKDIKNGLSAPPKPTLRNLVDVAMRWRWGIEMLGTKRRTFGNVVGHAKGVTDPSSLMDWTSNAFDPSVSWERIAELMAMWGGRVVLKGILDVEDARRAVDLGAAGIVVSNHGGRQLDGALSTIRMLPAIVDAVAGRAEVWIDSGLRSGQDLLKALCLGATGAMVGRPMVYGLGARGEAGVAKMLEVFQKELELSMALCGRTEVSGLDRDCLLIPEDFAGRWQA